MTITIFDGIVIGLVLFSAVLAMVRGFSREVLSIAGWFGAAAAAYYLYPLVLPYAQKYTDNETIAMAGAAGVVFVVALIVISLITMRIADLIIDSRIGALDRTLGFLFGAARGILIIVVAVAFWNWFVDVDRRPDWINNAKSKPFLDSMVLKLESLLPDDIADLIEKQVFDKLEKQNKATGKETAPAGEADPAEGAAAPTDDAATPPADENTPAQPAQ